MESLRPPGPALAHRAMAQGRVLGDILGGKAAAMDVHAVPRVVFAEPELAAVGLSEVDAREVGVDVTVGKFPLGALGRAVIDGATSGFAKLVFNRESGILVGAHLAGPRAKKPLAGATVPVEIVAPAFYDPQGKRLHG